MLRRLLTTALLLLTTSAAAENPPPTGAAEEADVDKIQEKYWARGNEAGMGVVQNRLYPKRKRIELGLTGGRFSGDPFLSTYTAGASLGFHFSELFAAHAFFWKPIVSPSAAAAAVQQQFAVTPATNEPKSIFGIETRLSLFYGKMSLWGAGIVYFDAYFDAGVGSIATTTGSSLLVLGGAGQQFHLSRTLSLALDFKLLWFKETVPVIGQRSNLNTQISLVLSYFFDPFNGDKI